MRNIILVWTDRAFNDTEINEGDVFTDHWRVFNSMEKAKIEYKRLLELKTTFSASITNIVESTDYDPISEPQKDENEIS